MLPSRLSMTSAALALAAVLAVPAAAQEGGTRSFTGLQLRGDQPIAIESNTLDVNDQEAMATFEGDVSVAQGPTELRAGKLVVHYNRSRDGDSGASAQPASTGSSLPGGSSSIERLEATGEVYVKSADQTASAQTAAFDMDSQVVVMSGNVTLSQGRNVATGCRLTIQMQTGVARLESSNCQGAPGGGGRVKMMLTPGGNN